MYQLGRLGGEISLASQRLRIRRKLTGPRANADRSRGRTRPASSVFPIIIISLLAHVGGRNTNIPINPRIHRPTLIHDSVNDFRKEFVRYRNPARVRIRDNSVLFDMAPRSVVVVCKYVHLEIPTFNLVSLMLGVLSDMDVHRIRWVEVGRCVGGLGGRGWGRATI